MAARRQSSTTDASFVFVSGSDEAEVKKSALDLAAAIAPSDDPFATEVIDGAVATVDEAIGRIHSTIEALLTLPFFGGAKLVWLKNASFLADTATGRSEAVTTEIDKLIGVVAAGLPHGIRFLLSAPEADKRRAAYKQFGKLGAAVIRDKPDFGWGSSDAEVVRWVAERARLAGLALTDAAAEMLAAHVGAETRQLDMEIEKLSIAFGPGRTIGPDDIGDLVPATRAGGIFDLGNALARRDLPRALASLDQLLRQGERGIGILLAAIVPTLRNLLVVRDLLDAHKLQPPAQPQFFASTLKRLPDDATAHLPRKKDGSVNAFALGMAAVNCRRFSLAELQNAFAAGLRANLALVTSQIDDRTVLTRLLVEIATKA